MPARIATGRQGSRTDGVNPGPGDYISGVAN